VEEAERAMRAAPSRPNRDGAPECYALAALLWAGRFAPSLASREASGAAGIAAAAALLAGAAFLLLPSLSVRRGGGGRSGVFAAFAAGFTGMALEGVLVLRFQASSGSLYGDLGILLFSFMAGMGAGAILEGRLFPGNGPHGAAGIALPLPILCAFALLCAGALASPGAAFLFRLTPSSALLFLGAALCGAAFARAARLSGESPASSPFRRLYAADLCGAAAALLASLLLLPFLGLPSVALLCAAACAGAALGDAARPGGPPRAS
jgi:hypothetical protein